MNWIWVQTNHFDESQVSLSLSIAKIPWRGSAFTGFIIGFRYKGKLIRQCTCTGASIQALEVHDNTEKHQS